MKTRHFFGAAAAVLALVLAPLASAHHSFAAEFDRNKPVDFTGTVTKVEWMNPHARFYIDVVDKDGNKVNWNFELTSPNVLMRRGWNRNSLKVGDKITVKGFGAKNAAHVGSAGTVTLADGRRIFAGANPSDAAK